jgi:hypothetical protein
MSSYSPSETPADFAARRTLSLRRIFADAIGRIAAARKRRRQCRELIDYIASDHRVCGDLGITSHEVRRLWRA